MASAGSGDPAGGETPWSPGADAEDDERPFNAGRPIFSARPPQTGAREQADESPRTANLRGTIERETEARFRAEENERLRREVRQLQAQMQLLLAGDSRVKNLTFRELTDDFVLFKGWRNAVRSKIMQSGVSQNVALRYIASMDAGSELQLRDRPDTELERTLDGNVYSGLLDCMKSKAVVRHQKAIEREGLFGNGRLAMKILERLFNFTETKQKGQAQRDLRNRTCQGIDGLASFMEDTCTDLLTLELGREPMGPSALFDYLNEKLAPNTDKGIKETSSCFANWLGRKHMGEDPNVEELLVGLEYLATEHLETKQRAERPTGKTGRPGTAATTMRGS